MTGFRLVFRVQDRVFAFKLILALLVYSLVPLAEIFLLVYLGNLLGVFPVLAAAALSGVAGVLLSLRQAGGAIAALKGRIRRGEHPAEELVDLAGVAAGGLLLLTPGFITDMAGFLLLVPGIRRAAGRAVTHLLGGRVKEVADSLRLSGSTRAE